tara:strand:- start:1878 stop:2609 length:732 start_codon:yes stop_codon:yes gene_type:complete
MIINSPTGLYKNAIPAAPSNSGNVTYTISMADPPRISELYPKIPEGVSNRKKLLKTITTTPRKSVGGLAFTTSKASATTASNNVKQFGMGQVLEFGSVNVRAVDPMLVSNKTEYKHDVAVIDYDKLGVDIDGQLIVGEASFVVHKKLSDKLNDLKELRANSEVLINNNQKIINETRRTTGALKVIVDQSDEYDNEINELIVQLDVKLSDAINAKDIAVSDANKHAADAKVISDELRKISLVMK